MDLSLIQSGLLCLMAGVAIGCFHFGGLWLTIDHAIESKSRALLFLISFMARSLVTLAAIYFATGGQWLRVLFCIVGILLSRRFFVAKMGRLNEKITKGRRHELHGH